MYFEDGHQIMKFLKGLLYQIWKIVDVPKVMDEESNIPQLVYVPNELIHRIQSLLPAKDAARTCVLSKSWLHAWSTIPTLRFTTCANDDHLTEEEETNYNKLIDRTLLRYLNDNMSIECLHLHLYMHNSSLSSLAEKWLHSLASRNCLKELSLTICDEEYGTCSCWDTILYGPAAEVFFNRKRQGNVSDIWETVKKRFGGVSVPTVFPNGNGSLLGVLVLHRLLPWAELRVDWEGCWPPTPKSHFEALGRKARDLGLNREETGQKKFQDGDFHPNALPEFLDKKCDFSVVKTASEFSIDGVRISMISDHVTIANMKKPLDESMG
nr:hypothetical protein [Tanacetum cinerariifolium]